MVHSCPPVVDGPVFKCHSKSGQKRLFLNGILVSVDPNHLKTGQKCPVFKWSTIIFDACGLEPFENRTLQKPVFGCPVFRWLLYYSLLNKPWSKYRTLSVIQAGRWILDLSSMRLESDPVTWMSYLEPQCPGPESPSIVYKQMKLFCFWTTMTSQEFK